MIPIPSGIGVVGAALEPRKASKAQPSNWEGGFGSSPQPSPEMMPTPETVFEIDKGSPGLDVKTRANQPKKAKENKEKEEKAKDKEKDKRDFSALSKEKARPRSSSGGLGLSEEKARLKEKLRLEMEAERAREEREREEEELCMKSFEERGTRDGNGEGSTALPTWAPESEPNSPGPVGQTPVWSPATSPRTPSQKEAMGRIAEMQEMMKLGRRKSLARLQKTPKGIYHHDRDGILSLQEEEDAERKKEEARGHKAESAEIEAWHRRLRENRFAAPPPETGVGEEGEEEEEKEEEGMESTEGDLAAYLFATATPQSSRGKGPVQGTRGPHLLRGGVVHNKEIPEGTSSGSETSCPVHSKREGVGQNPILRGIPNMGSGDDDDDDDDEEEDIGLKSDHPLRRGAIKEPGFIEKDEASPLVNTALEPGTPLSHGSHFWMVGKDGDLTRGDDPDLASALFGPDTPHGAHSHPWR